MTFDNYALLLLNISMLIAVGIYTNQFLKKEWRKKSDIFKNTVKNLNYWVETGVYSSMDMSVAAARLWYYVFTKKDKDFPDYFLIIFVIIGWICFAMLMIQILN